MTTTDPSPRVGPKRRSILEHTFIHLPGVGPATEMRWWRQGIRTWEELLKQLPKLVRGIHWRAEYQRILEASIRQKDNPQYFAALLKPSEHWRLYGDFSAGCAFLDIETTGGTHGWQDITVIGLDDGQQYRAFIQGQDLEQFEDAAQHHQLVVTFNGSRFDLPCIQQYFRNFHAPWVHIDLRYLLMRLGFRGSLKVIEQQLGIQRPPEVQGLNGYHAVLLWNQYLQGDTRALDTLIRYNREDVVNLKTLMDFAYDAQRRRLPLPGNV
jgi:uncharacterized protein